MYRADELCSEVLIDYLVNQGWDVKESDPGIAILRKFFGDHEQEIVLPKDKSYADYKQRIHEAIQVLARQEHISEKDIFEELFLQKWDVLRIRIRGDQIGTGCISFLDKGIIEEGVRKILLASARSVLNPKSYFKRLYSTAAEQWIKRCRSAVPESGSYILTLRLPLDEDAEKTETPFSRRVSEYLMTSLNRLIYLSENPDASIDLENLRLNANLCLGLAEMKPDEAPIYFDFEMKWSSEIPLISKIPNKVEIEDRHFPAIIRIGQKLKPQAEINQDVFVGKIMALQGAPDECGIMQGEIVLSLLLDDQQAKAKAVVGSDFYTKACSAHMLNKYVRISGILSEKPRFSDLKVSLFEILD